MDQHGTHAFWDTDLHDFRSYLVPFCRRWRVIQVPLRMTEWPRLADSLSWCWVGPFFVGRDLGDLEGLRWCTLKREPCFFGYWFKNVVGSGPIAAVSKKFGAIIVVRCFFSSGAYFGWTRAGRISQPSEIFIYIYNIFMRFIQNSVTLEDHGAQWGCLPLVLYTLLSMSFKRSVGLALFWIAPWENKWSKPNLENQLT